MLIIANLLVAQSASRHPHGRVGAPRRAQAVLCTARAAGRAGAVARAATIGMSKWYASICQPTDTSSGSRVRREGTTATSSKE